MATNVVRKCSIHRIIVVVRTTRNFISVECGMGYRTAKTTIPYQSLPHPFHNLIFKPKSSEIMSFHTDTK
jgi:hypothetical protein